MINGVKILNQITETHFTYGIETLIFGIIGVIIGLLLLTPIIASVYNYFKGQRDKHKADTIFYTIIGILILVASVFSLFNYFTRKEYTTTKYQVILEDTVKYNDFINTYDIISHEGNIYIVELKLEDVIKGGK